MATYDAAIIGLGAMGSAAAWHLARRGVSVIGFDQFRPPHNLGSSHGESRVIREAYYEDPSYVPLVQRAYELWGELGAATDQTLLRETGALMVSEADGLLVAGALASARQHGIPHEALTASEIRQRFPAMAAQEPMVGLLEHRAALMPVAECVEAQLELAARHGAELRFDTPIERWTPTDLDDVEAPIEIETADGTITAERLIITAGAWTSSLLRKLELPLLVSRQVAFWMQPKGDASRFEVGRMPIVMWERGPQDFGYAMPNLGAGVKVGYHYPGAAVDPSNYDQVVNAADEANIREWMARSLPDASGEVLLAETCLYTNTPDAHFLLDLHPKRPNIVVASPCSGHGFKFAPAIGESIADLALERRSDHDLHLFSFERLMPGRAADAAGS